MNLEFDRLNIEERPTIILETMDFRPIAVMGDAYELSANIAYNEVSEIQFKVPRFVDGIENTYYDEIKTMRIAHVTGLGRFVLASPQDTIDGICAVKVCKGYSLEYELTSKTLNLPSGTYNLWNPLNPDGTILGMFMRDFPHWKVNHMVDGVLTIKIDSCLVNKYRTFEVSDNFLNFFKSTAQQSYQCIFEFDPFERIISVRSAVEGASQLPIYIAPENLAKEIQVEELSDGIFTVFDVYGASGVDIRSVNPTGTNKIYNLDYYMTEDNFPPELIKKYHDWHKKIVDVRNSYYSYTIQRANAYVELELAKAELKELQAEYISKENLYSTAAQYELKTKDDEDAAELETSSATYREQMNEVKTEILIKEAQINTIQTRIEALQKVLDDASNGLAFESYFADELVQLSPYLKESVLTESSFVTMNTKTYGDSGALVTGYQFDVLIEDASVVDCTNSGSDNGILATDSSIVTYRADGGSVVINALSLKDDGTAVTTQIRGDVQHAVYNIDTKENRLVGSVVFQKEVTNEDGTTDTITATLTIARSNFTVDMLDVKTTYDYESEGLEYDYTGHMKLSALKDVTLYLTSETTEFQRSNVQWDLYDYAWELLNKSAYPSYSFNVSSANFLALDDFKMFKNWFKLGERVYLQLREGYVIAPVVVRAEFKYDDPESLSLEFANQFNSNSGEFNLVDLLEKSVSMGSTVDTNKFGYNRFVETGASTVIDDFMHAELDLALNAIKSSSGQDIAIDNSGIHLRKLKSADFDPNKLREDGTRMYDDIAINSEYDPCQIWMNNGMILFTDDGWQTCKMAIGSGSLGYGIIADYLVGTFVASRNLLVTNSSGTVTIDENGLIVDGMNFIVKNTVDETETRLIELLEASSSYAQATVPEDPGEGDLWYVDSDTDIVSGDVTYKHGKWYRFDGTIWVELTDADLSAILTTDQNGDPKVNLGSVQGVIDTTTASMQNTVNNLYMDESGLWLLYGSADPKTASKAIWINGAGIMISSDRTASNSDCPSYNENTGKSFKWSTAISGDAVAATQFIGDSIFGEIELGIGTATSGGFMDTNGNKWNFYVDADGYLHAQDAEVKGDIYCDTLYVDDEDIMDLLRALSRNVETAGEELELNNTELDIRFTRTGTTIKTEGGGITFTDLGKGDSRGNAGSFGANITANDMTGLGLKTKDDYPIILSTTGNMALDAGEGIFIGKNATGNIMIGVSTSVDMVSLGPSNNGLPTDQGVVYINGKTMSEWIANASGGGGTAVYA